MAEPWSGQSLQALPATALGALGALGSEFLREWEAQDMRVTLFKLLLLWLVLSLLCIQLAWGFYGSTVTGLYHRPGLGGQNGSTPDGSTHFPSCFRDEMASALHCTPLQAPPLEGRASVLRALPASSGSTCSSVKHGPSRQGIFQLISGLPPPGRDPRARETAANEPLKTHRE
ncbi:T-cell leukemia translocation-altered gene protein isoform X1 [Myotis daubentonii]|uniref:T-cell leukemia translocation-altered gene protein isoform X1 n=1 Tax=Myotis daubentonii TaxID=98922 RepID=UPI00287338B0|nr:T-cell leukemia translocation-altered gene protein isoform X1 [Myotis daubentonii]